VLIKVLVSSHQKIKLLYLIIYNELIS
jgi:hypothetical protein